ncbi:MAG: ThiF family adenylyltransferase [Actinomycetota bacterium]|nr:ThiF family adenylyltransferase [Actinomycetota bacterium]
MSDLGNRHRGDLGGKLNSGGEPVAVAVIVDDPDSLAGQHTTWMLLTLLARLGKEAVHTILVAAAERHLHPQVCPLAATNAFPDALLHAAGHVDAPDLHRTRRDLSGADLTLHVGAGPAPSSGWRVAGDGWQGTLTTRAVPAAPAGSTLPFGPYVAACLAAGEIFRQVRLPANRYVATQHVIYDLWERSGVDAQSDLDGLHVDFGLAGVGAVGCAVLQTLWATAGLRGRGVIADSDPDGVDSTNLNRCVLFDTRHIGAPKASTARDLSTTQDLEILAIDGPYDRDHVPEERPRMLLSAVDTNESRHALQRGLLPAPAIAASTFEMRAELLALGPPGQGPCLACNNPVLHGVPDDVHREHVRAMTDSEITALAERAGLSAEDIQAWAADGDCGTVSSAALGVLHADGERPPMFSVGFVSVFAGVALAAELLKEAAGHPAAGSGMKFQFMQPQADGNGQRRPAHPQAACPVCGDGIYQEIWGRRWQQAHP